MKLERMLKWVRYGSWLVPLLLLWLVPQALMAQGPEQQPWLEPVALQLQQRHQFKFAGYYAAQERGYYRDAGFEVQLLLSRPDENPLEPVLHGQREFGIAGPELLLEHLHGRPVVALAALYQHSPPFRGLDSYDNILFTSEDYLRRHPQRAYAFAQASLKGWQYALEHPAEIISLILAHYRTGQDRAGLEQEATQLRQLMEAEVVTPGYMSLPRWRALADGYARQGQAPRDARLDNFMFQGPKPADTRWLSLTALGALLVACCTAVLAAYILRLNRNLRRQLYKIQALKERLAEQVIHDPLTGLFNRRYLDEVLERELSRAARTQRPLSLLMIDIDHFKCINDTFGHPVGDRILRQLGALLGSRVRTCDIACRYGGEEFIVLMPEAAPDDLSQHAEQLRAAFAELIVEADGQRVSATLSIGIASCHPELVTNASALVNAADQALYRAKQGGRNRVMAFRPSEPPGHRAA